MSFIKGVPYKKSFIKNLHAYGEVQLFIFALHVLLMMYMYIGSTCRSKFIDVLMKTYTSEAVFLLTTFVNMARKRITNTEEQEEIKFINFVAQEIFQVMIV